MAISFFSSYRIYILFSVIIILFIYLFLVIFPVVKSPYIGMKDYEISRSLKEDEKLLLYLNSRINENLKIAIDGGYFDFAFNSNNQKNKSKLKDFWIDHLDLILELDILKDKYKSFYKLSPLEQKDFHTKAFNIGHISLLAQNYYTLLLSDEIKNEDIKTFLNEKVPEYGIRQNTYTRLENNLIDLGELIRINTGRLYSNKYLNKTSGDLDGLEEKFFLRLDKSISKYSVLAAKNPLNFLERTSVGLWYPIQRKFAITIGYLKTSTRDYHIDKKIIDSFSRKLQPGDILLGRKEWHVTNVGIPGFWTHAALYTGSIEYMNNYFNGIEELHGESFESYLKKKFPRVYKQNQELDEEGFKYSVIESRTGGVMLTSLEDSANIDSLAVLRVNNISKSEQFKAIIQAFKYIGKPYDYDFNFITENLLVCSELIYRAYENINSIEINPKILSGRLMFTPNDFVQKIDEEIDEKDSDLELVLFLDGNNKNRSVIEKSLSDFRETWRRPKWHIIKDYLK